MTVRLKSGNGTNEATIDNGNLHVALPLAESVAGFAALITEDDGGTYGSRQVKPLESDQDYRLRVGQEQPIAQYPFPLTTLDSTSWISTVSTMTTAVSGGYVKLNSGSSVATSAVARLTSHRSFSVFDSFPLYISFPMQLVAASAGIANTTWEIGLYIASGITAPTDGIFLRMNASGELRLVCNFNGAETTSDVIVYTGGGGWTLSVNTDLHFILEISANQIRLWVDNALVASMDAPTNTTYGASSMALPFNARIYNSAGASPSTATSLWLGPVHVQQSGQFRTWSQILAGANCGSYLSLPGAGSPAQTANWTNSAEPAAATLSNTAAGYTTLGGQWSFAAPAGAATDFCLFGYQVTAQAANSSNKNLRIDRIRIDAVNVGAAVATTATVIQWGVAVGSTAVSLATAEAATTKAPRRTPLGMQSWIVGAAIGAPVEAIDVDFSGAPLFCEAGNFVQIIVRVPIGTATASQVIRGTCTIIGQWD